jgi:hypothetical protein
MKMNNKDKSRRLREAMLAAVSPKDVYDIVKLQVFLALRGDPLATREVLDRVVGKANDAAPAISSGTTLTPELLEEEVRAMHESVPRVPRLADPEQGKLSEKRDEATGKGAGAA